MQKNRLKLLIMLAIVTCVLSSGCISSDNPEENTFADAKKEVESLVNGAVELIESEGPACFDKLRSDIEWNYEDMYVYVWRTDGTRVVYPPDTSLENIDVSRLEDSKGRPIGQLFIEAATTSPYEGWVMYEWPKPNSDIPSIKYSFNKKATYDSVEYLVGAGVYASDYLFIENIETCANIVSNDENDSLFTACEVYNPKLYEASFGGDFSVSTVIIEKDTELVPHAMKNAELYIVLSGEGILYIEDMPIPLAEDDMVMVPAGATQYVASSSEGPLKIMLINQPAWSAENEEMR